MGLAQNQHGSECQRKCKAPVYMQRNDIVTDNLKRFEKEMDQNKRHNIGKKGMAGILETGECNNLYYSF